MNRPLHLDRAAPGQGRDVARLIAASLQPRLRQLTIWQSSRASRYVETLLRCDSAAESPAFYLLCRGERPAGVAAFRLLDGAAFLNHLYVAPLLRGQRCGAHLFAEALRDYLHRHPCSTLALDVFSPNALAESWYVRLAFQECSRAHWWIARPSASASDGRTRCLNLAAAARQHRRWGFSSFVVVTAAGRHTVGRLPAPYFRLTDPAAARDPQLLAALSSLDPHRRLLLILPANCRPPTANCPRPSATTRRLQVDTTALLSRLKVSGA